MQDGGISNIVPFRKMTDLSVVEEDARLLRTLLTRNIWGSVLDGFVDPILSRKNTYQWIMDWKVSPYAKIDSAVLTCTVVLVRAEVWVDSKPEELEWRTHVIQSGFLTDRIDVGDGQEWARDLMIDRSIETYSLVAENTRALLEEVNQKLLNEGTGFICLCEKHGDYTVITHMFVDGVFSRLMYTEGKVELNEIPFIDPQFTIPMFKKILADGKSEAP